VAAGLCLAVSAYADDKGWLELGTDHFIVCHTGAEEPARATGREAENWYARLMSDFGLPRRGDSWQWERRIRIRLYPSAEQFRKATGAPEWAGGRSSLAEREISTWEKDNAFTNSVLPHELAHLILREYIGPERDVPLWFVEGVTQWAEPGKRLLAAEKGYGMRGIQDRLAIQDLQACRVEDLHSTGKAAVFYRQSLSLVAFIMAEGGSERFGTLCRHLRDGKTLEQALRFTYPNSLRTMTDLERSWLKSAGENHDSRSGGGGNPP